MPICSSVSGRSCRVCWWSHRKPGGCRRCKWRPLRLLGWPGRPFVAKLQAYQLSLERKVRVSWVQFIRPEAQGSSFYGLVFYGFVLLRARPLPLRRVWIQEVVSTVLMRDQAEKLDPQPQVEVAFGFLITNWEPCKSSL